MTMMEREHEVEVTVTLTTTYTMVGYRSSEAAIEAAISNRLGDVIAALDSAGIVDEYEIDAEGHLA